MRRSVVAALLAVTLSACTTLHVGVAPAPDAGGPLPGADVLLAAVAARREAIHSLRTLARLAYESPEESHRARQLILAARPDRLRMELFSPFGTVFVLTTLESRLAAYSRGERTVYRGAASAHNLERYASVALPVATAVDLLMGTPPLRSGGTTVVSRDEGYTRLWQDCGTQVRVAWFGAALEPVRYEELDREGRTLVRARFSDYAETGGVRLPMQLTLELPPTRSRVDITLDEPEVNPRLADAQFVLDTPPGSREVDLDGGLN